MAKLTLKTNIKSLAKNEGMTTTVHRNQIGAPVQTENYSGEHMILLGKFKVERNYFDLVESAFTANRPLLLEHVEYTPEDLIGEELWADLGSFFQLQATLCLRHMATLADATLIEAPRYQVGISRFQMA